jgi:catechol 2,3-dioxygenase-like lactoylglutathione lyase family enzyme
MSNEPIGGIDHVVIVVADLDKAEAAFRRLGFTLSPRAVHSADMGTANHTIMLQQDYFELLGVMTPADSNRRWRTALERGEGVGGFAVQTSETVAAREAWREAGFAPSDVRNFSRAVERADGSGTEARFEIVSLPNDTLSGVAIFACAQLTREAVWLPELMEHPNTARAIRRLTVSVPDPDAAAAIWGRALPGSAPRAVGGGVRIRALNHLIDLIDKDIAAQRYGLKTSFDHARVLAIEFAVRDVDLCRTTLQKGKVATQICGDDIGISASDACGVAIAMVPATRLLD